MPPHTNILILFEADFYMSLSLHYSLTQKLVWLSLKTVPDKITASIAK